MQRNYILPSEVTYKFDHDCRNESTKFKERSLHFDVSVFTSMMSRTKTSLNSFYDKTLYQPEVLGLKSESSSFFNENRSKNKCLKEIALNNNPKANYGNIIWSNSITCASNGDMFLVDRFEHRVLVFNKEFIYKYQIGSKGSNCGEFDEPTDACISESGKLYVADKNNSRVQIFSEAKRNRESKGVKLSTSLSFGFDGLFTLPSTPKTFATAKTATTKATAKTKIFRTTGEFCYQNYIELDDKPIKLCSSPFSGTMAVSTEKGIIFILNEFNEIIAYLKMNRPVAHYNISNFFLDEFGENLTVFHQHELDAVIKMKKYSVQPKKLLNPIKKNLNSPSVPYKMELNDTKILETTYSPGIKLNRIGCVKLSIDSKHFLVFDALNLNLLEYDCQGEFQRIVLKAEEHLGKVLAFDFNGDHLVTSEIFTNRNSIFDYQKKKNISTNLSKSAIGLHDESTRHETHKRELSKAHNFKLKLFRYMNCQCHKHLDVNQSLNEFRKLPKSGVDLRKSLSVIENDDFETFAKSLHF